MRIRNLRKFAICLSYAGQDKKGWSVPAGKLSPELPSDRFYDPHLQYDWKKGAIDVILNEADMAVLGSEVAHLTQKPVTMAKDAIVESKPEIAQPVNVTPVLTATCVTTVVTDPAPATQTVATPPPPELPIAVAAPPAEEPPALAIAELAPPPTTAVAEAVAMGAKEWNGELACAKCNKRAGVSVDPRVNIPLCRYCRAILTRDKGGMPARMPEPLPSDPVPKKQADCPHQVDMQAPVADPRVPGIPWTPPPQRGRSLADLRAANKRLSYTPKFGDESGIPVVRQGDSLANRISKHMGGIQANIGTPSPMEAL